jgi:membrane-bound serine protease (ClpP class)
MPVDSDSTLLTVNGKAAAKLGLAREVKGSLAGLTLDRNYNVVVTLAPSGGDKVIEWLNNPFLRMLLMVIFAQCLYAAMHAPGHGFAEVLAVIALTILVGVPLLTGYAQWWEIVVILIGVVLLALEIFVLPGFGIPGILGIVMVLFGLIMTFVGSEPAGPGVLPKLEGSWTNLRTGLAAVTSALIASIFLSMWLRRYLPKLPYLNRLILTATTGNVGADELSGPISGPLADFRPVIGAMGQTQSELKPGGLAAFIDPITGEARNFSVLSDLGYIPPGTKVAVRSTSDNRILVRPVILGSDKETRS